MSKKKRRLPMGKKQADKSAANTLPDGFKLIKPEDTFRFQCSLCGGCCREVRDAVMLESLDLYRLAKHFNDSGCGIRILTLRQIWCEGTFAAQKERHNLRRIFRRGLQAAEDHCLLSATVMNLKRMAKCLG